jgi:hypothetical protein
MELGKLETINQIIKDLFIDLRKKVNFWSSITDQTPQARMGYIGQHLVSAVTGYKGGKSGARGFDLVLPDGEYGEIKSCYRVDQLGLCLDCKSLVSSLETSCSACGSINIYRNDDSKWLISIQHDDEFKKIIDPKYYYFILFEFEEIYSNINNNIIISIWRVNPKNYGFTACMADYYLNIKSKSKSGAPFNMWPYMIKFYMTKPSLLYRSRVTEDDSIETLFYDPENSKIDCVDLANFSNATTISHSQVLELSIRLGMSESAQKGKKAQLTSIDSFIKVNNISFEIVMDLLSTIVYEPLLKDHHELLPEKFKAIIKKEE